MVESDVGDGAEVRIADAEDGVGVLRRLEDTVVAGKYAEDLHLVRDVGRVDAFVLFYALQAFLYFVVRFFGFAFESLQIFVLYFKFSSVTFIDLFFLTDQFVPLIATNLLFKYNFCLFDIFPYIVLS